MEPKAKRPSINMAEIKLDGRELGFVTSIHRPTRTFFVQLCKFTNEELLEFSKLLNNHCTELKAASQQSESPAKIRKGAIVCILYDDANWYRALVLNKHKENSTVAVMLVDFGNIVTVNQRDVVVTSPEKFPAIEKCPFGITCTTPDSLELEKDKAEHMLDCLNLNYLMIKVLSRESKIQWLVDIPKHAYNTPFWHMYEPMKYSLDMSLGPRPSQTKCSVSESD